MSKTKRRRNKQKRTESQTAPATRPPRSEGRVEVAVGIAVLAVFVVLTIMRPRPTGDTFMALKGGQDVVERKLGKPDDWAFTTVRPFVEEDRIWINQSWGSGLLFYGSHLAMGDTGVVVIKAFFTAALAVCLVLASRELGANWSLSLLAAAVAMLAMRQHIDMRPNLIGMTWMVLVLWLLFRARNHPARIWWVVPCVTLWAHMHGSFVFGIGMVGLWTICSYGVSNWYRAGQDQMRALWPLPVAAVLCILLPAAGPFWGGESDATFLLAVGRGREGVAAAGARNATGADAEQHGQRLTIALFIDWPVDRAGRCAGVHGS